VKRRWPRSTWLGLLLVLAAPVLHGSLFVRFPVTRDFPWPLLLMFGTGLWLLVNGLRHAYRKSAIYRGKVVAPLALVIGVAISGFFSFAMLYGTRQIPASSGAPRAGQPAPDFTLPDQDGQPVTLAQLIAPPEGGARKPGGVLLIFYRGYW
jgi:hypothetical protein